MAFGDQNLLVKLITLSLFKAALKERWNERKAELLSSVQWLTSQADFYETAIETNYKAWPSLGRRQWPHTKGWQKRKTYAQEFEYLTAWIKDRYSWYDKAVNEL